MERKIINELLKWKLDKNKKPILLYGVSGCGKTYTTLEFGKQEYKNVIYFDCFNNLELSYVFDKNTTLEKLIRGLSAISLETIFKEETLIIFDNVNEKVCNAIKKLLVNDIEYHVIMITNSEGFLTKNKADVLNIKKMTLVNFAEYLKFYEKEQLVDFIEDSFKNNKQMPFHTLAMELYNDFVITGGYPEVIVNFRQENDYNLLSLYQERNMKLIKNRLLNLNNLIDIKRGNELLDNMSFQLLKDNKKFLYGLLKSGARSKEYEKCIDFMERNNLIIKSYKISELKSPLSKIKDNDSFKLYFNDSGLLFKRMNISNNRLFTNNKLLETLYENNIVSTLSGNGLNIYYYHSGGKSELDLVVQTRTGKIIPMEILHGDVNTKSKSMGIVLNKFDVELAIRFGSDNFSRKKKVKYIPYYAAFCITESL